MTTVAHAHDWSVGDVKDVYVLGNKVFVELIDEDCTVRTERHYADEATGRLLEEALAEGPARAREFFESRFDRSTRVDPDPEDE